MEYTDIRKPIVLSARALQEVLHGEHVNRLRLIS
ncbi:unnamed protein product, partial [marine sediment metagenome]